MNALSDNALTTSCTRTKSRAFVSGVGSKDAAIEGKLPSRLEQQSSNVLHRHRAKFGIRKQLTISTKPHHAILAEEVGSGFKHTTLR